MQEIISRCPICEGKIENLYSLDFEDILGMASEYTQKIGYCPECGFIFTMNPFSAERLSNRYKKESKFEYDASTSLQKDSLEYITRSKRIKNYIQDRIGDVNSVLEVGASSGYNLSLYNKGGVLF